MIKSIKIQSQTLKPEGFEKINFENLHEKFQHIKGFQFSPRNIFLFYG